jgi:heme/copper-type cytochrome/quinol oxidase subunit 4
MSSKTNKPPIWYWIVSILALIWNIMGVMAYLGQAFMSDDVLKALPEAEQALYNDVPAWATAAFAIAVWGGALGSLFLIFRKKAAKTIFILSFLGIVVQMVYNLFMSKASEVYGPGGEIMPITVIIIGAFLIWFSNKSISKGWIS